VFGPWLDEMPNTRRLTEGSIHGPLESTIPPITVPAWMSMMTSKDAGQLGMYGFRNRSSNGYGDLFTVDSSNVKEKTVWNYLSRNRLRSILVGIPLTYPPKPLNGLMVCSFLTPNKEVEFTYPPELKNSLDEMAGGDYIIDVEDFRSPEKQKTLDQIYAMTKGRFRAFRRLLQGEEWDFAMMVEMGPDRVHHAFWRYHDRNHRLYEKGHEFEDVIHQYYLYMDSEIGKTLDVLPADTSVMIVSDHGAKGMHGAICINEYLIREGLLSLKAYPGEPTRLKTDMIDWNNTRVWGDGGYYARIFLNVEGREPNGQIPASGLESFKRELKSKLEALEDENGKNIGTKVFFPEEIYKECKGIPPDMIVYLGDLDWRSAGTVGNRTLHLFENDTGPDDANHAQDGIFIWHNRGGPSAPVDKLSIYDIAPSILDFYGIDVPNDMIGKTIP
jgi:predicted AlkP superfamily phosphohydrolase/phosphomutase